MFRSISIQAICFLGIFVIIFNTFSWFKETSMLATDTQVSNEIVTLPTLMNSKVELHSKDAKTIVYFFAPWCQICHLSIDNLQDFYLKNENVNVVAVALDYTAGGNVSYFAKQHELTFPIAFGNEEIKKKYNVTAYPSYYVIDEKNTVIAKSLGYSTEFGMYLRTL